MEKFILNVKKSEYDQRDWSYEKISTNNDIPNICDYRSQLNKVRNQGQQGTCYAQSAACMKEWQENIDYGFSDYFSPQFFYNNRNYWNNSIQDGDDLNEDYGMTGRDVMRILKEVGICKESDYPYGLKEKACVIDPKILIKAKKHNIKSYARINSLDGLKRSLYENGPCLIAFPVYNYSNEMWIKNEGDDQNGGHAMTVVGYDDINKHFIIRNSWGSNWGDEGYCYYQYKHWDSHWEAWTTIDLVSDNKKKSQNLKLLNGTYNCTWEDTIHDCYVDLNRLYLKNWEYDFLENEHIYVDGEYMLFFYSFSNGIYYGKDEGGNTITLEISEDTDIEDVDIEINTDSDSEIIINNFIENGEYNFYVDSVKTEDKLISNGNYIKFMLNNVEYQFIWNGEIYMNNDEYLVTEKFSEDTYILEEEFIIKKKQLTCYEAFMKNMGF